MLLLLPSIIFRLLPMDYVTRQFINLAKKLRDDLRTTLQKQTDAIRDAAKAARENKLQPLPVPLPVIAELQIPEADKRHQRRQHQQSHRVQVWLASVTTLAFVAAAIYAGIAVVTWKDLRHQTSMIDIATKTTRRDAANQLLVAEKQLESNTRSWIKIVDLTTIGNNSFIPALSFQGFGHPPFPAGQKQATFQTKISLKNVGNSPAFVTVDHELFFPAWKDNFEGILRIEQKRFCETSAKGQTTGAVVRIVFPNEPLEWDGAGVQSLDPIIGTNATNHIAEDPTGEYVLPAVIVCANYNSRGAKRYQTMALYIIVHKETGNRFFKIGEGVPARELRIIRDELADDAY
jgi:hypothetical protein